jgi:hypothetical protein
MFTRDMIIGFVAGIAAGAFGHHYYKKNQAKINAFLAGRGINLPNLGGGDASSDGVAGSGDIEDLVAQKERLEDLIAEQEAEAKA